MDTFLSLVYEYFLSLIHGYVFISGTWIRFCHWYMSTFLFLVHEYVSICLVYEYVFIFGSLIRFYLWYMDTFLF